MFARSCNAMSEEIKENLLNSCYFALNNAPVPTTSTDISQLNNALFVNPNMTIQEQCIYSASLPSELASNFPEGTILQILPDSTILAVPPINNTAETSSDIFKPTFPTEVINDPNSSSSISNLLIPNSQNDTQGTEIPICSEGNMSDIDLSFLNETEESVSAPKTLNESEVKELQTMIDIVQPDAINVLHNSSNDIIENSIDISQNNEDSVTEPTESTADLVTIDVSKPIQLSQNSLIMVNGRKCVLQQDIETGQVIAYPVKEPDKPHRKRGRPRKKSTEKAENAFMDNDSEADLSEEEREKGLHEVVNDDGSLVRKSSRRRKKSRVLKDYETGNLKQELGSDIEDSTGFDDFEIQNRKKKHKGPGRPRKYLSPPILLPSNPTDENKRPRGRPKKETPEKEPTQAFLVQTADGQTLMMQVPVSSIPAGLSLQEVAQNIANRLKIGLTMTNNNLLDNNISENNLKEGAEALLSEKLYNNAENSVIPALQDHSIGSTTNPSQSLIENHTDSSGSPSLNLTYNLEEVILDSMGESVEINKVDNKPNEFLPETLLQKDLLNKRTLLSKDNFSSSNSSNNPISINDSLISSLPTQIRIPVSQSQEQSLVNILNHVQLSKDFLIDGEFLKDKVNIQMLLQNVGSSTEEPFSEMKIQNSLDVVNSVKQENFSLNSTDPLTYTSETQSNITDDSQVIQEISCLTNSGKSLDNYTFLNCNSSDSDSKKDDEDIILRNHAILSSIEHDHDFQMQAKKCPVVSEIQSSNSPPELIVTNAEIQPETQTLSVVSLENIPSDLKATSIDNDMCSATVVPIPNIQSLNPEEIPGQEQIKTNKCKICHKTHDTEDELIEHFKSNHPKCICNHCNYLAEHAYVIKRHSLRHLSSGCVCKLCGKHYKDHYILKMHIKMVHLPAEAIYTCDICEKKFTRKAHLKRHLRIHEPNKPYKCSLCNYRGCERSDITKHLLVHDTPKHKCDICDKTFRHLKNKDLHLKRHYKQKDYKCGICDFYGYTFTDIRKHIERRHSGTKTVSCDTCGLKFKNKEAFEVHKINGQCEKCLSELEIQCNETISENKKDITFLEDMPLNILEESEHAKVTSSVEDDCESEKLETVSIVLNPTERSLHPSQNGQLEINDFASSDLLSSESFSLIHMEKESNKLITLIEANGKSFTLPLKNESPSSLENVLMGVTNSNEETFFLSEIETEM